MPDIRAITLDLDDTLWPIEPVIRCAEETLHRWFARHAPAVLERLSPEDLGQVRRAVFEENPALAHDFSALRRLAIARILRLTGYPERLAEPAFEAFFVARHAVSLFDDVLPALERLASRYPIVALTNGNAEVERVGLGRFFKATVFAREVGAQKPAAAMFLAAARALGLEAGEIVHAGDHLEHDVQGALDAGFNAIWINRTGHQTKTSDHETVACLGELADLLETPGSAEGRD